MSGQDSKQIEFEVAVKVAIVVEWIRRPCRSKHWSNIQSSQCCDLDLALSYFFIFILYFLNLFLENELPQRQNLNFFPINRLILLQQIKFTWYKGQIQFTKLLFNFGTKFLPHKYCPSMVPNEYLGDLILTNDVILCHMA